MDNDGLLGLTALVVVVAVILLVLESNGTINLF
jgi:hypothetical protein